MSKKQIFLDIAKVLYFILGLLLALPVFLLIYGLFSTTRTEQVMGFSIMWVYATGFILLFFSKSDWRDKSLIIVSVLIGIWAIYVLSSKLPLRGW
ncbi:hypothetical protein [Paenibacillus sp. KN14-4R]|uniref:hypothetical protein n=1 Tax=Paenibacillus sp. KN14-4R TaxID=3445773 RepID=UPI003FA0F2C2